MSLKFGDMNTVIWLRIEQKHWKKVFCNSLENDRHDCFFFLLKVEEEVVIDRSWFLSPLYFSLTCFYCFFNLLHYTTIYHKLEHTMQS